MKILTVANNQRLRERVEALFPEKSVSVLWEKRIDRVLHRFASETFDVLMVTSSVCVYGEGNSMELLDLVSSKSPTTQILFLAEDKDIKTAMSALKAGTYHYVRLPVGDEELKLLITTAAEDRPRFGTNVLLHGKETPDRFERLIGRSNVMQQVYEQIRQAAAAEIQILLLGETGSGKDLAAQAIHRQSRRRKGPYIPVNLGALPSDLVASELFGHQKGSFTGAVSDHHGKFEQATDGTIFLDEIDTIDEKVQVSLLRLLEEKKLLRLGGKSPIKSNARLVAASNTDLEELVRTGSFRQDLFYRLDVFRITLPPLRERQGDISLLVEEFVTRFNQSLKKTITHIAPNFMQRLETYDWPGNVRELKNVVQRAVLVCQDETIREKHLPPRLRAETSSRPSVSFEVGTPLETVEREMILRALQAADNNRTRAAELLGISRRAIYNKLRKHNIE